MRSGSMARTAGPTVVGTTTTVGGQQDGFPADTVGPMGRSSLVIFDGDDTLWSVEPLYDAALDHSQQLVERAGLPGREWRRAQRLIDLHNVETLRMSRERFPRSSVEALEEVALSHGRSVSGSLREAVREASATVFSSVAGVVDHAAETLEALRPHFALALLTKGDDGVQRKRIADSGLGACFDHIEITAVKDEQSFAEVALMLDCHPNRCWSIGNSIASDINPALRLGMHAIWIDAHVWEHERRETMIASDTVTILRRLRDVPDVLLGRSAQTA